MFRVVILLTALTFLANCQKAGQLVEPPIRIAGYANGTDDINTVNLTIPANSVVLDRSSSSTASGPFLTSIAYRVTADPDVIIMVFDGVDIPLTLVPGSNYYDSGQTFPNHLAEAKGLFASSSEQVGLALFGIERVNGPPVLTHGYSIIGLQTDPANLPTSGGTATYTGPAIISQIVEPPNPGAIGTAALNVNFSNATISGQMDINGAAIGLGPSIILGIDPSTITGNGFSSTLTVIPGDLGLTSVSSTAIIGNFYGPGASDLGATFIVNGPGAGSPDTVDYVGGLIAAK